MIIINNFVFDFFATFYDIDHRQIIILTLEGFYIARVFSLGLV